MNILTRKISIHAPPRGATDGRVGNLRLRISIHAPPRGATNVYWLRPLAEQFQFTPLREGRLPTEDSAVATPNFNSRPSARGDVCGFLRRGITRLFQFTPLREGRRKAGKFPSAAILFQFTPLREGRLHSVLADKFADKFQFTPLREGRPHLAATLTAEYISIHAPPRGATRNWNS